MVPASFVPSVWFLDRDGTIVEDVAYMRDPNEMRLMPGAAEVIARLNALGTPVIVVTNQSGIARGLLTLDDYRATERRLDELLAANGAHVDATYFCPHHPDFGGDCACRKPAAGMYRQAIREHSLDASRAAFIGDRWRDVAATTELGGVGVLVMSASTPDLDVERARNAGFSVARNLSEAIDSVLTPPAAA